MSDSSNDIPLASYHSALERWVTREGRTLPWRAPWGDKQDPYRAWLAEIMLQQTQVATVIPYYQAFLARWPDLDALADAPLEAVLHAWQGLGYYARARNLHACAKQVKADYAGRFPSDLAELRRLPGIGEYVAAAIRAIAFQQPAVVVDGNIERIMTRLFAERSPIADNRRTLRRQAAALTPSAERLSPGTYAQALMDLGAMICRPRIPLCGDCPVRSFCRAAKTGRAEQLPTRKAKPKKPLKRGLIYWIEDGAGQVAVEQRPAKGLLGGMYGFPGSSWCEAFPPLNPSAPPLPGQVTHVFTHFRLELRVVKEIGGPLPPGCFWHPQQALDRIALPSLMQKVAKFATAG